MKKYCKALVNLGVAFIILTLIVFLVPKLLVFLHRLWQAGSLR